LLCSISEKKEIMEGKIKAYSAIGRFAKQAKKKKRS